MTEVLTRYGERKPALIFCGSKKGAEALASKLGETASALTGMSRGGGRGGGRGGRGQGGAADPAANRFSGIHNQKLRELLLSCGGAVAWHHAGLSAEDRATVEALFQEGVVRILCSTSTLALGLNSPTFLVVLLGTTFWRGAGTGYEDLPVSAVLQMIGRAGRPGYDDRGVAVIMTSKDKQAHYEGMAAGQEEVESQLSVRLHEALNAEICSRVIQSLDDALRWLRSTFLWVRMHKNPRHYASIIPQAGAGNDGNGIDARLKNYLLQVLDELQANEVVKFEPAVVGEDDDSGDRHGGAVTPLVAGKVMCKTLVSFETIKVLRAMPLDASLEDLLWACCQCVEVCTPVRKADKRPANDLLKKVRFAKGLKRVQLSSHKTFVLLQALLGNLEISDFTLKLEAESMLENMARIMRAMQQYCVDTGRGGGAYLSLLLGRSLRARMWETEREAIVLRQVEGIGATFCGKLGSVGIKTFEDVVDAVPAKLEMACNRRHPFGLELVQRVKGILDNALAMHVAQVDGPEGGGDAATLVVELSRPRGLSGDDDALGDLGLGSSQRRDKRWMHSTLVAFSSGRDRSLLLFREIPFQSSVSSSDGSPVVHRIEFRVPRPVVTPEEAEGQEGGGGEKRFRVTLGLVSPFIGLDCLQLIYPTFAPDPGNGGGGRDAGARKRTTATSSSTAAGATAARRTNPGPKKAKLAAPSPSAPPGASAAVAGTLQEQQAEQRAKEMQELRQREAEQERQKRQQQHEEETRWRAQQTVAAAAAAAEEGARGRRQEAQAADAEAGRRRQGQAAEAQARQQPPPPQPPKQQWKRRQAPLPPQPQAPPPPPSPPQQQQPRQQEWRPSQLPQPSLRSYRFEHNDPNLELGEEGTEAQPFGETDALSTSASSYPSQDTVLAPPSPSLASDGLPFRRRSYPTQTPSPPSSSSSPFSSLAAPLPPRPPVLTTLSGATSEVELSMLKVKARETQADQVPIHRIPPKASPTGPAPVIILEHGPLLSRKVVGSSSRSTGGTGAHQRAPGVPPASSTSKFFFRPEPTPSPSTMPHRKPPAAPAAAAAAPFRVTLPAHHQQRQQQQRGQVL